MEEELRVKLTDGDLEEGRVKYYLEKINQIVEGKKIFLLLALTGIFFIGLGIFITREEFFGESKVEVLGDMDPSAGSGQVFIEIAGAVEKPGVYEFNSNERVDSLLIASGGLSSNADREWVEKNINRAALLKDGQKIYIPREGEVGASTTSTTSITGSSTSSLNAPGGVSSLININTASSTQLDRLDGIGAVRAQKIIDNRPYSSVDELLSKKILPKSVFEGIKDKLTAP